MMFLKFRYRLGYEALCREVADSISWRRRRLADMTDGELIEMASEWTQHRPYEMELQRRLIVAIKGSSRRWTSQAG